MTPITLTEVLKFLKSADEVELSAVRAAVGAPFRPIEPLPSVEDLMKPNMLNPFGLERKQARAILAEETLSKIDIGNEVTFPYNGVQYTGQVVKINRLTAKVRITKMSGAPTKKGVVVGANVKVSASILARSN